MFHRRIVSCLLFNKYHSVVKYFTQDTVDRAAIFPLFGIHSYKFSVTVLHRNVYFMVFRPFSVLSMKETSRKKIRRQNKYRMETVKSVVAYAVAEELNLAELEKSLHSHGLYQICQLPEDVPDALRVIWKYNIDANKKEVMFFHDGSVVFWSVPETERNEMLRFLHRQNNGSYPLTLLTKEAEQMDLISSDGSTTVAGGTISLDVNASDIDSSLEKYAISNAMAQSVQLAIWEFMLEELIDYLEPITIDLKNEQKITVSRKEVLRKTGELFSLRHQINLRADLLDSPDFYWDHEGLEPLYLAVHNHLDILRRTKVMNERISHMSEVTKLLKDHLNDAHHTRLEIMIIVLILIEVVFEILHCIERYGLSKLPSKQHLDDES